MATLSQSQVYALALAAGLPDPKLMAAIAMAESSGRTDVVNSIGCVGLWQINQPVHVKSNPTWTVAWLKNPMNNALAAKKILKEQGLGAWEVYTGPDGKGADGPFRDWVNKPVTQAKWDPSWIDPLDILPDGVEEKVEEGLGDVPVVGTAMEIGEALERTADVLTNPRTWLRVAYGVTGAVLIIGGLFLIVKNTSAGKATGNAIKKTADTAVNFTPVGRGVNTVKAAARASAKPKPKPKPAPAPKPKAAPKGGTS